MGSRAPRRRRPSPYERSRPEKIIQIGEAEVGGTEEGWEDHALAQTVNNGMLVNLSVR